MILHLCLSLSVRLAVSTDLSVALPPSLYPLEVKEALVLDINLSSPFVVISNELSNNGSDESRSVSGSRSMVRTLADAAIE